MRRILSAISLTFAEACRELLAGFFSYEQSESDSAMANDRTETHLPASRSALTAERRIAMILSQFRLALAIVVVLVTVLDCSNVAHGQSTNSKERIASPIAIETFSNELSSTDSQNSDWNGAWTLSAKAPAVRARNSPAELTDFGAVIRGTKDRNNPLRRQLDEPFDGAELFVRFLISYDEESIDKAPQSDGEFFVLWLDSVDGGDTATHSSGVPNIGLHVDRANRNSFMVRFGSENSSFGPVEVTGDREFLVVAKVAKSSAKKDQPYDQVELWVNPNVTEPTLPQAAVYGSGRVKTVKWLGFSTGRKTETTDRIVVDDLVVAESWEGLFGLPKDSVVFQTPQRIAEKLLTEAAEIPPALRPKRAMPEHSTVSFRKDIFPILERRCFKCHRGLEARAGYRLDLLEEILGETNGEPLAVPGHAARSRLVEAVTASLDARNRMPPKDQGAPLNDKEVALLKTWIDEGLAWDDALLPPSPTSSDHWAFQRVERPVVPDASTSSITVRTPIDAFVLAKHIEKGIKPVRMADEQTLQRRVALDLLGLPPSFIEQGSSPSEKTRQGASVGSADQGDSDERWADYVDQLLDSPQYGVRWGRHWLDVARWAESNGYQHNRDRPHAWRYRDYVIDSFNADKPFDRFITEQLAGDELEPLSAENLIATGFLAAAQYSGNEKNKTLQRYDILVDIVNATGNAMLGLTFECCQCHNHKFDPISARDYYRFQGFFAKGQPVNIVLPDEEAIATSQSDLEENNSVAPSQNVTAQQIELCDEHQAIFDLTHDRLYASTRRKRPEGDIFILPQTVLKGMRPPERRRYDEIGRQLAQMPQAWTFYSPVTSSYRLPVPLLELRWPLPFKPAHLKVRQQRLHIRGDADNAGPVVLPGWPSVFGTVPASVAESPKPRSELAKWMTSRDNPLTARVWVNRIWQWHFGKGLVEESGNFGLTTSQPEFHELLDWLAVELMENGWSTKNIHRLILNSSVYRLSSEFDEQNEKIDSENSLFWRWMPRRLEAESLRDCMLASASELSLEVGGPSVRESSMAASPRRSVYLFQKRNVMPHMQDVFDGPAALTSCSKRRVSTVPLQPLFLLNSRFVNARSSRIAADILAAVAANDSDNPERVVELAFLKILNRHPDEEERTRSVEFLRLVWSPDERQESTTQFCHALLNLNEFAYIP